MVFVRYPRNTSRSSTRVAKVVDHKTRIEKLTEWANSARVYDPFTKDRMIIGSSTYMNYVKECKDNGLKVDICNNYKWVMIGIASDAVEQYNVVSVARCKNCTSVKTPFLVHSINATDYVCIHCNKDVNIRFICTNCRGVCE